MAMRARSFGEVEVACFAERQHPFGELSLQVLVAPERIMVGGCAKYTHGVAVGYDDIVHD